jgi:flagellin
MLSLISALTTPAPLPGPQSLARTPAVVTAPRGGPTGLRDVFALAARAARATDIGALAKAAGNARDGVSLLQVAAQALDEIDAALTEMEDLATQASSTTTPLSRAEQAILNVEFQDLLTEIDRIADETEFNGINVLEGGDLAFKVGTGTASQDSITLTLPEAAVADLDSSLASDDLAADSGADTALTNVTNALDALHTIQASVRGSLVAFLSAKQNLALSQALATAQRSDLLEKPVTLDTADQLARAVSEQLLQKASPAIVGQLSGAVRNLLSSARLQPLEPAQAPVQAPVPEKTGEEVAAGPSASRAGQDTKSLSRREPYQSVDVEV